jgi:hypothetical protein
MCAGPLRQEAGFNAAIIRPILSFEPGVFIVSCRDPGFQHLFFRVQKPRDCHPVITLLLLRCWQFCWQSKTQMFFVGVSNFTANSANGQGSLWGNHFLDFFHRHCLSPEILSGLPNRFIYSTADCAP